MRPLADYGNLVSESLPPKVFILVHDWLAELEALLFLLLLLELHDNFFQLLLRPFVKIEVISVSLLCQEELLKVLVTKSLVDDFINQESLFCHAGNP